MWITSTGYGDIGSGDMGNGDMWKDCVATYICSEEE